MQIHGWVTVRATFVADEDAEEHLDEIVDNIQARLDSPYSNVRMDLNYYAGEPVVHFGLGANHYNSGSDDVFDVFRYIAHVAPGSYGCLHIYDYEGRYGDVNRIYVLVMSRGKVVQYCDPLLSPVIPRIEDPDPLYGADWRKVWIPAFLPLGSVVTLKDGEKKLMVFGRCQRDTAGGRVFDYVGVPYPEGNIMAKATFLFNHEDILEIHYLGFADDDENAWVDKLKAASASTSTTQ